MRSDHEVAYQPFLIKREQIKDADQIIATAKSDLVEIITKSLEDPTEYEYDVVSNGKAVKVGNDMVIPGVGRVPADVVLAGLVVAWRKGTEKPRISGNGRMG